MQETPSPADQERADKALGAVLAILTKSHATDDQLRTFLALLFVQVSDRLMPSPGVLRNAGAAATLLGINAKDKPADVEAKLESATSSLPPALKRDLEQALRELVLGASSSSSDQASALVGGTKSKKPVGAEPAPAGSVKGGMGARLSQSKKKKARK